MGATVVDAELSVEEEFAVHFGSSHRCMLWKSKRDEGTCLVRDHKNAFDVTESLKLSPEIIVSRDLWQVSNPDDP